MLHYVKIISQSTQNKCNISVNECIMPRFPRKLVIIINYLKSAANPFELRKDMNFKKVNFLLLYYWLWTLHIWSSTTTEWLWYLHISLNPPQALPVLHSAAAVQMVVKIYLVQEETERLYLHWVQNNVFHYVFQLY